MLRQKAENINEFSAEKINSLSKLIIFSLLFSTQLNLSLNDALLILSWLC